MDKRKKNTVKIVSTVISLGIIAALIIGVVSVIKSVNANRGGNNNIVNLNETEENVAIKTEDITDEIDELGTEEILQEANARGRMAEDIDISATESTTVADKADKENVTEEPTVPPTMSSEEVMAEAMKSFSFDESNKLAWPVLGHITLDYSMDETVLFKSLGVYKCSPGIIISSEVGTNVGAAASGIVTDVAELSETGTTVTVSIGNGYETTTGLIENVNLRKGDKVAIVSLSSGMLGEAFCSHNIEIGVKRLREYGLEPSFMPNSLKGIEYLKANPKARAKDLKDAFMDDSIAGIICAIGGDDTYRLLPYLLEDEEFIDAVHKSPKLFTGFSDTTINHLMFYKLGLSTYYGPNFICDLAEISDEMLPYSKKAFESYIEGNEYREITSSEIWYQERTDFSKEAVGTERISHREEHGFELLQGKECFEGRLLGGCLESLYDILTTTRYEDEKAVCEKYGLFPDIEEWKEKILFIETCEEKPVPEQFEKEIAILKEKGVFDVVSGVLVGKPQDEAYYDEYKNILVKVVNNPDLPIVYNVNFGHATPRCTLQYGAVARVDMKRKIIKCEVM